MDLNPRVVVTGAAADSCCGVGSEVFWHRLCNGTSATVENGSRTRCSFVPIDTASCHKRKIRTDHAFAVRLTTAIQHDLGQFLDGLQTEEREHVGVALGSAYGHLRSYFAYYQTGTEKGYQFVNPRHFPFTAPNFCTVEVNNVYSLWGSSTTVGSGLSAGLEAVGYATAAIRGGQESAMLAGGLDELNDYNQHRLQAAGLCSLSGVVRPFSPNRDGTVAGEGLAVLLLQSEEEARRSRRKPLAEICGYAGGCGVHWTDSNACRKAVRVIHQALTAAGLECSDIDVVFPSANGTIAGDAFELVLLHELFGKDLPSILVCPVKAFVGECFAASGVLQCLGAVYAVGRAPEGPSSYVSWPCDGTELRVAERIQRRSTALVYSAGYDGTFSALVVRRLAV
jgi:3-oxoacyl-(acyl-carrier-protein) synthase